MITLVASLVHNPSLDFEFSCWVKKKGFLKKKTLKGFESMHEFCHLVALPFAFSSKASNNAIKFALVGVCVVL